ncbi:unnamed protein product, partial [Allacma fusca]
LKYGELDLADLQPNVKITTIDFPFPVNFEFPEQLNSATGISQRKICGYPRKPD